MDYVLLPYFFVKWYVTELPFKLLRLFLHANLYIEDQLAIRLHLRLLFVPLFHDLTIVGRLASIVFRFIRVIGGVWVLFFVNVVLAVVLTAWFTLPVAPLLNKYLILVWPVLLVFYVLYVFHKPKRRLTAKLPDEKLLDAADYQVNMLLSMLRKKPYNAYQKFILSDEGTIFFTRLNVDRSALLLALYKHSLPPVLDTRKLLQEAKNIALADSARIIDAAHLFTALAAPTSPHAKMLAACGVVYQDVLQTARWITLDANSAHKLYLWDDDFFIHLLGGVNRGWLGVPTPVLNMYSTDVTEQAQRGRLPPVVGRDDIIEQIIQVLAKSERENVLLLGESGSGKTSVVNKIAERIIEGGVPKSLFSKRIVRLESGSLVAGVGGQGGLEERMKKIMDEIKRTGNVILFLDDIQTFESISSGSGNLDMFNLLKAHMSANELQVIAATSYENFSRFVEPNTDFVRLFQKIEVPVVNAEESVHILQIAALALEAKHQVIITLPALLAAVSLSDRYIHSRVLPGKAIDLLDEACALTSSVAGQNAKAVRPVVEPEVIETLVEQKTHVQVHNATARERDVLLNLEAKLHQRLVGQNEAVAAVADALRRARSGLHESNRPIASFLFVGPTGVGKTELAKSLAEIYFGSQDSMVRFDMSEYQDAMSSYRLIGVPPENGGQVEPGRLTEAVRERPSALILLDEIEKASLDVVNLFLQVFDDGRLTDSLNRTVTFRDTIIIATSNAATREIEQGLQMGQSIRQIQSQLLGLLVNHFPIEFLNRFDGIILFKPLDQQDMIAITKLMLAKLGATLAAKGYAVAFSRELIASLATRGFNPLLGARPLRRLIQEEVESQLAKLILSEKLKKNQKVILGPEYLLPQHFAT